MIANDRFLRKFQLPLFLSLDYSNSMPATFDNSMLNIAPESRHSVAMQDGTRRPP